MINGKITSIFPQKFKAEMQASFTHIAIPEYIANKLSGGVKKRKECNIAFSQNFQTVQTMCERVQKYPQL